MASSSRRVDAELVLKRDLEAAGLNLLVPPHCLKKLSKILQKLERLLSKVEQDPSLDILEGLYPVMKALITQKLMWNSNLDIRVFVLSCLSEIIRIAAPKAPYDKEKMKEIFLATRRALEKLYGASENVLRKIISILHNIAKVRSCPLMLDLGCDQIIVEVFELFFGVIGPDLSQSVVSDMETIMTLVIEESDDISSELLRSLLNSVREEHRVSMPRSWELGQNILKRCADKLKPCLPEAVRSIGIPLGKFPEIVSFICQDTLEDEPTVSKDNVVTSVSTGSKSSSKRKGSPSNKKVQKAFVSTGKMAIKEEAKSCPATNKRTRKPNPLMGSDEGYTLPTWTTYKRKSTVSFSPREKGKTLKPNDKVSKRPRYFRDYGEEKVGKKIRVWWSSAQTYSEGTISSFDPTSKMHTLLQDDGDEEMLDLGKERWEQIEAVNP